MAFCFGRAIVNDSEKCRHQNSKKGKKDKRLPER
jgi:hypothetical protein